MREEHFPFGFAQVRMTSLKRTNGNSTSKGNSTNKGNNNGNRSIASVKERFGNGVRC
jgi:hypothetical protein